MPPNDELSPKELLDKLRLLKRTDRKRISLYLSEAVYRDFTKVVGEGFRSAALEQLMVDFIKKAKASKGG